MFLTKKKLFDLSRNRSLRYFQTEKQNDIRIAFIRKLNFQVFSFIMRTQSFIFSCSSFSVTEIVCLEFWYLNLGEFENLVNDHGLIKNCFEKIRFII
jgi:hypothetical protein